MIDWILATIVVLVAAGTASALLQLSRKRKRKQAAKLRAGEHAVLTQPDIQARVYVDQTLLAGPVAGKINNLVADLVLTPERLLVSTHQGRLLEITRQLSGSVRCTGPGRLVIEGSMPRANGEVLVRIEALVATAETWSTRSQELLGTSRSAVRA